MASSADGDERGADPLSRALQEANESLVLTTLRTQERLEVAEAFRLLVESVEDYAIFRLDAEGHVAEWNAGAARVYGYVSEDIVGQPFSVFYYRGSVESGSYARELAAAKETGRVESESMRTRQDGSNFWGTVIIAALRDERGRHTGFATATRDLTERLRAEQERVRLARAEETERRKDEFLAIMGHELRNPLAPMVSAIELIKLRGGRHCENELAVLDRQVRRIMRLVEDLIDVARTVRDGLKLSPAVIEVGQILASALEVASPFIQARDHDLRVEAASSDLRVNVDSDRMVQVFVNLLNNAAKYTPVGGQIRLTAVGREEMVEVTVTDSGSGIAPDLMPRIFELFTQGEQGIDRQLGGLGVGLAIAQRLVHEHGGELSAESEGPNRGSRFTVRLPRAQTGTFSVPPPPAPVRAQRDVRRVLVVDDNEDAVTTMSALLERCGHETRVATDGLHAIEIAHEFEPDIVLLDIGLPGLDGFQVARRLRQIPACEGIPIVAVTGYAREWDRQQALQAGFSDHFAKPIDPKTLERVVEMAPGRQ
jgi:PAS domain S-box-containing protein